MRNVVFCAAASFIAILAGCGMNSEVKNDPVFEQTATIYTAAEAGDLEAVRYFMSGGEGGNWDPGVADYNGVLPLCYAAKGGNVEIIWMMVQGGANVNLPDNTGKTPLQYAKEADHKDAVQYLQELGATE